MHGSADISLLPAGAGTPACRLASPGGRSARRAFPPLTGQRP